MLVEHGKPPSPLLIFFENNGDIIFLFLAPAGGSNPDFYSDLKYKICKNKDMT